MELFTKAMREDNEKQYDVFKTEVNHIYLAVPEGYAGEMEMQPISLDISLGICKHYRSDEKLYEILGLAWDPSTLEQRVVYKALYDIPKLRGKDVVFLREKSNFFSKEEKDGKEVDRFVYVKE